VLTVGATHVNDRAAAFSNHGDQVDLVAPGVDVLSLRARFTDANYRPGVAGNEVYTVGDNVVGEDQRYLHVSGTSFSAPIVTGTASLILAVHPELTGSEVERILIQTATDLEFPGKDPYTGYGMVNAQAALAADPQFAITAEITGAKVEQTEDGGGFVRVTGSIDAPDLKRAWMQMGPGENPGAWRFVGQKRKYRIANGTLGTIPLREFTEGGIWQIVINVEDRSGIVRRAAYPIRVE
jgi:subtilisin family serine protease